jgi:hypothetical protein
MQSACSLRSSIVCGSPVACSHTNISRRMLALAFAVGVLFTTQQVKAQATSGQVGQWQVLANRVPINPIHAAVMHNGKVLMIEGRNTSPSSLGAVWDPATQQGATFPVTYTMFCNAMVVLPDGRPFVMGGTVAFPPPVFTGENKSSAYDLSTGVFTDQVSMAHGRWYPTGTVLNDGTVLVFSGDDENDNTNSTVEIFTPNSGTGSWSAPVKANFVPPTYPRLHLLPDGRIFYSGLGTTSKFYDLTTQKWTDCCTTNFPYTRGYGTSVLLPITPANGYKPKVMIMGGGRFDNVTPATNTTEIVDLSAASPQWTYGPNMSQPRIHLNATILPSGNVLVTGGSAINEKASTASFNADLYHSDPSDPRFNQFTSAGVNSVPRLYHSNAILLPDASVILTGSNPANQPYENRVELYQPAYLFNFDGTLATRPTITGVASVIHYNTTFPVQTPDAASITSVVLIRPAGVTHSFDMEQRLVRLPFTKNAATGTLTVNAPPNGKIAPPGYYMVFILNSALVPSVANFVQICPYSGCL